MNMKFYAAWTYVSDLPQALDFYTNKLGLRVRYREEDWVEFDLGGAAFAILQRPPEKGAVVPRKLRIMLEILNMEEHEKKLRDVGVKIVGTIRQEAYGKLLTIEDPDGHWLELYEKKKVESP